MLLTACLVPLRDRLTLVSDILLFLLTAVVAALVGGPVPALLAAVLASVLLNYFFTPPLHTLAIDQPGNSVALVVFVLVALLVSGAVDLAARRSRQANRAEKDATVLAEADRVRAALLAAVGHDLRTPLAAAKASVSSLRSKEIALTPADRQELLAAADESLDRLIALVENLLDMSRLQAGAMPVRLEPVALAEVVAGALHGLGPDGVRVVVDVPDDLAPVLADPGLLERVLVNLMDNALAHSTDDQPPQLIALSAQGRVELRVVDRGPGIPIASRPRMFVPFQRLGDHDNAHGVGLGLALSRGLAEAMGARVEPVDTAGGGLTMVVSLCVATDRDTEARPAQAIADEP